MKKHKIYTYILTHAHIMYICTYVCTDIQYTVETKHSQTHAHLQHVHVSLMDCPVDSCFAILVFGVHITTFLDESLDSFHLAALD